MRFICIIVPPDEVPIGEDAAQDGLRIYWRRHRLAHPEWKLGDQHPAFLAHGLR